jgi:hypothetical protein
MKAVSIGSASYIESIAITMESGRAFCAEAVKGKKANR